MSHTTSQIAKIILISILGIFISLPLMGCQCPFSRAITPKTIEGFSSPESIAVSGKYFFVSNMGEKLEPSAKDNDGFISRLSASGDILDKKYLPEEGFLNSPKGIIVLGDMLFVADVDRVVGFNITTRKQTFELDFSSEKTSFLNDLVVIDNKTLLVSATDVGKIYKISLGDNPSFSLFAQDVVGANGLCYYPKTRQVFVVSFGRGFEMNGELGVISLDNGQYQKLTQPLGGLDGIALVGNSKLIFSNWVSLDKSGILQTYGLNTKVVSSIKLSQEVHGPADLFYDSKTHRLWLPKMLEGKVLVERIE